MKKKSSTTKFESYGNITIQQRERDWIGLKAKKDTINISFIYIFI